MLQEFKEFILRGNLVELAVAVVIGVAFQEVISSLVANILTPIIAAFGGQPDFSALSFTINDSTFTYGAFINSLISFLVVAAAVFFFVVKPVNALMERRRTEVPVDEQTRECPECVSDVPARAKRCAFCTAQIPPHEAPAS